MRLFKLTLPLLILLAPALALAADEVVTFPDGATVTYSAPWFGPIDSIYGSVMGSYGYWAIYEGKSPMGPYQGTATDPFALSHPPPGGGIGGYPQDLGTTGLAWFNSNFLDAATYMQWESVVPSGPNAFVSSKTVRDPQGRITALYSNLRNSMDGYFSSTIPEITACYPGEPCPYTPNVCPGGSVPPNGDLSKCPTTRGGGLSCSVTFDQNPLAGASTTMRWTSSNASLFYINNVGYVGASGSSQVFVAGDYSGHVTDASGNTVSCQATLTRGTSNQCTTSGSGSGGAGGPPSGAQTFSKPGTYAFTVPSGISSLHVEVWGAGGSGSQCATCDGAWTGGGGGGGGGYATEDLSTTNLPATVTVTVGAGGASMDTNTSYFVGGADGQAGGASSFGTLTAQGGAGGMISRGWTPSQSWAGWNKMYGDGGGGGGSTAPSAHTAGAGGGNGCDATPYGTSWGALPVIAAQNGTTGGGGGGCVDLSPSYAFYPNGGSSVSGGGGGGGSYFPSTEMTTVRYHYSTDGKGGTGGASQYGGAGGDGSHAKTGNASPGAFPAGGGGGAYGGASGAGGDGKVSITWGAGSGGGGSGSGGNNSSSGLTCHSDGNLYDSCGNVTQCQYGCSTTTNQCINQCTPTNVCNGAGTAVVNSCTGATIEDCAAKGLSCVGGTCAVPDISFQPFDALTLAGQPFTATGHLQASPTLVPSGASVRLYWNVLHAQDCAVSGNGNSWNAFFSGGSGKTTNPITQQTVFTLHCDALPGATPPSIDESATVNIVPSFNEQ